MADKKSYGDLKRQLEDLLAKLDSSDIDMDEALDIHSKAKKTLKEIDKFIKEAEIKVSKISNES